MSPAPSSSPNPETSKKSLKDGDVAKALARTSFTCSGSLTIDPDWEQKQGSFDVLINPPSAPPVTLRWDGGKIQLPVQDDDKTGNLDQLIKDGAPATFGHHGNDVLDESYRKAIKLDRAQFSSDFHPHDHGILDAISQTLLPTIAKTKSDTEDMSFVQEHWGLVADLYKLNIYSAPSGHFKAHVDTPRGPRQWGSLVVCLPVSHNGGQLRIAHGEEEVVYDWGNADPSTIEWAAFYSDCEHEVLEVTKGHRITLTYNLYVSEQLGGVIRSFPRAVPSRYPCYEKVKALLEDAAFWGAEGGKLGFYCMHHYAHAIESYSKRLPYALKGSDAIFYSVVRHLGYPIEIRPILSHENLSREDIKELTNVDLVGRNLTPLKVTRECADECYNSVQDVINSTWRHDRMKGIHWLNKPSKAQLALVHLAYGNEPGLEYHYSSLALIVHIPPTSTQEWNESKTSTRK